MSDARVTNIDLAAFAADPYVPQPGATLITRRDDIHARETRTGVFSPACRDEAHFNDPGRFDITRDTQPAISFGAGAAARCLIAEIALPLAFRHLKKLRLTGNATFTGRAFRGPTAAPAARDR